jgi:hypothetical protein
LLWLVCSQDVANDPQNHRSGKKEEERRKKKEERRKTIKCEIENIKDNRRTEEQRNRGTEEQRSIFLITPKRTKKDLPKKKATYLVRN